jgi:hypothetical protein
MGIKEIGWEDVGLIGLAQNRDRWRIFVNAVMNLCSHKNVRNVLARRGIVYVLKKGCAACRYLYVRIIIVSS